MSECGAYLCNDTNTACRVTCEGHADCADGYVCEPRTHLCRSGGCEAWTDVMQVEGTYPDAREMFTTYVAPLDQPRQAIVVAAGDDGISARRYDVPAFVPTSDTIDATLHGARLDGPTVSGTYEPVAVYTDEDATSLTVYWVRNTPQFRSIRSATLPRNATSWSPSETVYSVGLTASVAQLAASVADGGGVQLAWTESHAGALHIQTQYVRSDGTTTEAQRLGIHGRNPAVVTLPDRVDVFWVVPSSGSWSLRRRSSMWGERFDTDVPDELVHNRTGRAPLGITAARANEGVLLFTEFPSGATSARFQLDYIASDGFRVRGSDYLNDFAAVESVHVVPDARGGAWAVIVGGWIGQRGLWLRYIDADGVPERYPVRILSQPLGERRVGQVSLGRSGDEVWITWTEQEAVGTQRHLHARGFLCDMRVDSPTRR